MRKLFTFLFAALMSVGMYATTVTWNNNDITGSGYYGTSFTKDGVTITAGFIDFNDKNFMNDGTFTTTLGNFTKIEVSSGSCDVSGTGWSGNSEKMTWTGNASSVSFSGDFMGMGNIKFVFTIEEPLVAVTGVTLNQSEAQMTVGGETLTLTATVNPNNATDQSVSWSTSDANVATVDNGVVTAVAAGNATITVTTTDGSFTATCAVTVTAPEPEPQPAEVTVVFAANNKTVERTVTLPHTFKCNANSGMEEPDELDNIIYELYNGDYAQCNYYGVEASGSDQVEAGKDQYYNDYITIKGVFEGTATVTGSYYDGSYADHNYTLTISIKGDEPEPEPEPEPVTTYNVTFTDINSNVKVVENITLPHTFSCDYTNGNGELDLIIQEFYNEPGGHCATNGWPWGGNDNEVVVGHDGNNHFVTINAPFIGTSFMSGYYDGINDGNFYYTFHITIAASTPEPEPQPVTDPITPYVDPQDASVYYSTFYDSNFKYELPTGVEAYVADLSGANLLLTKIAEAGEVIPADNAVILKSTVTPINLTQSDAAAVTFTATNDLQGSDTQIATPANCYVLAGTDGVVGFYHYTAANLNAHKAYVVYSGSNQAPKRMPFIFDQATGVESIQHSAVSSQKFIENGVLYIIKNGVKYNVMGQEVK